MGAGTIAVKLKPERIRMRIVISAKGKTLKEALNKLKDRREAAILQLEQLGATKDSIHSTTPAPQEGQTEQEKQMRRMLIQQLAQGRKMPKGLQVPKTVRATTTMTADWQLASNDSEEILLFSDEVKEKIVAVDLAGLKDAEEKSPEEEELAEEMAGMMGGMGDYGDERVKSGEPQFVYIGVITEQLRMDAMKKAFAKAKIQATMLATAAGKKLGGLASLTGTVSQTDAGDYGYGYFGSRYAMRMAMAQQASNRGNENRQNEAVSAQLETLAVRVYVQANFDLAK